MSWAMNEDGSRRRGLPVTGQDLEERINMYISAMDKATSVNDESMSAQLQRDIQHLVDLMEKVSSGQAVMDTEIPPPLVMTPIHDAVANPLGELSSRLSDYHKALYFAEEELSENRLEKIQTLQKGLQTIHSLQKKAQAGFPIKEDEIPGPVSIPDDSEFDNDALNTITTRLEQYKSALSFCENSTGEDRRRIPKLQSSIRKLNFLLTRAQVKRPVWRKDIPSEFDYYCVQSPETKVKSENVVKLTLQAKALQHRVSKCTIPTLQETKESVKEGLEKLIAKWTELKVVSAEDSTNLAAFTAMLDNIEASEDTSSKDQSTLSLEQEMKMTEEGEKTKADLTLIDSRIKEYKAAATKATHEGNLTQAIKDLKVVKGLQPMRDALEKGEKVDMTLVPPPPQDMASVGESPPPFANVTDSSAKTTAETAPPQSAHAQVSPFNIRPSTETAEDKLARKLTSFLEDEGEVKSYTSASSSSPSSLESELSPVHRPGISNDKMKAENVEKRLMADTKESTLLSSNIDASLANQAHPKSDTSHSNDVTTSDDVNQSEQMLKENVSSLSAGLNQEEETISNSLHTESDLGAKEKRDKTAEEECKKYSLDDEKKNNESRSDAPDTTETSEIETQDGPKSPTKVSGSKNPLDKIGFLACQDVPLSGKEKETNILSLSQNAETVNSSTRENGAACEIDVKNRFDSERKEQSQNEKDSSAGPTPDSNLVKDPSDENSMSHSTPSSITEGNNLDLNKPSSANETNLPPNITDSDRKETLIPPHNFKNQFSGSENSSISSLPYSVNNQIVSNEMTVKNDLPYISNTQENENTSVAAKSDVKNFYNLSGDCNNLDDASDMQEFQELMDSMSIVQDATSVTTSGATGVQSLETSASSNAAANLHNSALYSSSTIPESTYMCSGEANQNLNHVATHLNSAASNSSSEVLIQESSVTQLNAQPCSTLSTDLGPQQESLQNYKYSMSQPVPSKQDVQLTGLETLKYDLLLTESKTSRSAKREAEQLQEQMEKIKYYLKQGDRKDWEDYMSCLEKEWKLLNDGVKDCGERQEWDTYKYLNNKRMLNERELCYLKQHIEEVK